MLCRKMKVVGGVVALVTAGSVTQAETLALGDSHSGVNLVDTPGINLVSSGLLRQRSQTCGVEPLVVAELAYRPANGQLYMIGYRNSSSQTALWRANAIKPVALPVAVLGSAYQYTAAMDFSPSDELRVIRSNISATENQNIRINPDTGAIIAIETPLSYTNVPGAVPRIGSIAFTNDSPPRLLGIDYARRSLVAIGSAAGGDASWNSGLVTELTPISFPDNVFLGGFDVSPETGVAYVQYSQNNSGQSHVRWLSTINLSNGQLTVIAQPFSPGVHVGATLVMDENLAPPPVCPGDSNFDLVVNACDLSVVLGNFGNTVPPPDAFANYGDLNGDSVVNGADLSVLLGNWSAACE